MKQAKLHASVGNHVVAGILSRGRRRMGRHDGSSGAMWKAHFAEQLEPRVLLSAPIIAFGAQMTFGVGAGPAALAVADLNRDGKLDVITANSSGDSISELSGLGNGLFAAQVSFAVGGQPKSMVAADINGDAKLDLIVANLATNNLSILIGNGDGTFFPQFTLATGLQPASVAVLDINGDGKPDIAVANYGSASLSILAGNGDGTFKDQQTYVASVRADAVAIGDLNVDGKPDVVVVGGTSPGWVYLGGTNGVFQAPKTLFAESTFNGVVADINQDGRPEVVFGSGANVSGDPSNAVHVGGFGIGGPLAVADVDVNGTPDFVVSGSGPNQIRVEPGAGGTPAVTFAATSTPGALAVADLNADGRPDAIFAYPSANSIAVRLADEPPRLLSITRSNNADQYRTDSTISFNVKFSKPVTGVDVPDFHPTSNGPTVGSMSVIPLNTAEYIVTLSEISGFGDVGLDFVDDGTIKDADGNPLQPGGTPSFQLPVSNRQGASGAFAAVVADFNRDGKPDVALPDYWLEVLLGNGNGNFAVPRTFDLGPFSFARSMTAVDLNGDAKPDIVLSNFGTVSVLLGNGDGTFRSQTTFMLGGDSAELFTAAADMNGDGCADLMVSEYQNNAVGVLLGNGDGSFRTERTFATGGQPQSVAIADINRDGVEDVAVTNSDGSLGVLFGNGDGTLGPRLTYPASFGRSVAVADLNADGKPDLILGGSNEISILLGNGNGTLQSQQTVAALVGRQPVTPVDVNQDGKLDLIIPSGARMTVFLGNGDGTFGPATAVNVPLLGPTSALIIADLNRDAKPDVIVTGNYSTFDVVLNANTANLTGPGYSIFPDTDVVDYATAGGSIGIGLDPDGLHVLVASNTYLARLPISDPNGLTVNGDSKLDFVYINSNAFPNALHLNGNFEILPGDLSHLVLYPLEGKKLDIGSGTVYLRYEYPSLDPLASINSYLSAGYNGGAWNGPPTPSTGVITSSAAAADPSHFAIGYADSADGAGVNTVPNSIELKFTLKGDANLNGAVDISDLNKLLPHFNGAGDWTAGDFNYDGKVDVFDLNALLPNFNTSLTSQAAQLAGSAGANAATLLASASQTQTTVPQERSPDYGHPGGSTIDPSTSLFDWVGNGWKKRRRR